MTDDVTYLGIAAFKSCTDLTFARLSSNVDNIRDYTFQSCGSLTQILMPCGLTSIGNDAFAGCSGFDATNKWEGETDREWGRTIEMDAATRERVDSLWNTLGIVLPGR